MPQYILEKVGHELFITDLWHAADRKIANGWKFFDGNLERVKDDLTIDEMLASKPEEIAIKRKRRKKAQELLDKE